MKRQYMTPRFETVIFQPEAALLGGSIVADTDGLTDKGSITFESGKKGGWNSTDWTSCEE